MTYTLEDFDREIKDEILQSLTDEDIENLLKKLGPEKRMRGLGPEERLRGLAPEENLESPESREIFEKNEKTKGNP